MSEVSAKQYRIGKSDFEVHRSDRRYAPEATGFPFRPETEKVSAVESHEALIGIFE